MNDNDELFLLFEKNVYLAALELESKSPEIAIQGFFDISGRYYSQEKNLAKFILVSELAAIYCLRNAAKAASGNSAMFKKNAKVLLYNLGANLWPGWGDEGICIDKTAIQIGRLAAQESLDLVYDLKLGPKEDGNGLWLIGALDMALGDFDAAAKNYKRSKKSFLMCDDESPILMVDGYSAILDCLLDERGSYQIFEGVLARVARSSEPAAKFISQQLLTAQRFFSENPPANG